MSKLYERLRDSLWIGWTLTLFFNWVAFFWIGFRARNRRWILWGLVYAIPFAATIVLADDDDVWESWPGDLAIASLLSLGIASIVHAFVIRPAYIAQRRAVLARTVAETRPSDAVQSGVPAAASTPVAVNSASEQELARLPGIGPILAKRVVAERRSRPFRSVEDLGDSLGLSPHVVERLRPLVRTDVPPTEAAPRPGRVVDY